MSNENQGTIKVKPWDGISGDFVVIDADQFNPDFHEKLEEEPKLTPAQAKAKAKAEADAKAGKQA